MPTEPDDEEDKVSNSITIWTFSAHQPPCRRPPRVFSRAIGYGVCREPACTLGASLSPGRAPCRALWSRSKSPELTSHHGIAFRPARASPDNRNPYFTFFWFTEPHGNNIRFKLPRSYSHGHFYACVDILLMRVRAVCAAFAGTYVCAGLCICVLQPNTSSFCFCFALPAADVSCHVCITPSLKLLSSLLCGGHGTTAVAHQVLPFVMATDGTSVCACACHVPNRNEHIISREVQGCCAGSRATQPPVYVLGISKATAQPPLQQKRCNSSTTAPALHTLTFVTATMLLCSLMYAVFTRVFIHALNHDHVNFFPRTYTISKSNTRRRTSSYHTAVYKYSTGHLIRNKKAVPGLISCFENGCLLY